MNAVTARDDPRRRAGLATYLDGAGDAARGGGRRAIAGSSAAVGAEALAAGGKRLRPLLVFLCAAGRRGRAVAGGRRGRARPHGDARPRRPHRRRARPPRPRRRVGGARRRSRRAPPATTSSPAPSRSWPRPATRARSRCSPTHALCLARGEAMQRTQAHDPDTAVEAYLERCALKTGKLFEAACLLGGGDRLGEYGLALGIAFQIADDILDCAGETIETGKVAGTDLREGTPTLPLLLAARQDPVVRARARRRPARRRARPRRRDGRARAVEGARPRLRSNGARHASTGERAREELDALTYAVVMRGRADGRSRPHRHARRRSARRSRRASGSTSRTALALLESDDLLALGELADLARRMRGGDGRRLLRPEPLPDQTNVCRVKCKFCAFAATQKQERAYTLTPRSSSTTRSSSAS